ncbi:GNAT family N-acetyltransferase [Roseomonas sp. AR75]|uniref:GNAT family N-acetyltransferase n=1 Tax=Roseomonas sp. AR75 TaxID=2562311 RepID=UPI0010C0D7B7|nr:GNAT family N-acetyltransferase [Roseomonas sp. AR75]
MSLALLARPAGLPPPWPDPQSVTLRPATMRDAEACGRVLHAAQRDLASRHGVEPAFASAAVAAARAAGWLADPAFFAVVAEHAGEVVGVGFLQERDEIRGIGPTAVAPRHQMAGIGRRLLRALLDRAEGAAGARLVQDAAAMPAAALHAALGFEVKAPLLLLEGCPRDPAEPGEGVRPMRPEDVTACDALHAAAHGVGRAQEIRHVLEAGAPLVLERRNRIAAYLTAPEDWQANHGAAETAADLIALLAGAARRGQGRLGLLVPSRQSDVLRWCLQAGMRAVKPMVLLARGSYRVPARCWVPSGLY